MPLSKEKDRERKRLQRLARSEDCAELDKEKDRARKKLEYEAETEAQKRRRMDLQVVLYYFIIAILYC